MEPLATTSYAVSLTSAEISAIGAVDPVSGTATVTAHGDVQGEEAQIAVLQIASDRWAKVDLGTSGDGSVSARPSG